MYRHLQMSRVDDDAMVSLHMLAEVQTWEREHEHMFK